MEIAIRKIITFCRLQNRRWGRVFALGGLSLLGVLAAGCHSLNVTVPKRSAAEQLLLSTAVDQAFTNVLLAPLNQKRVYLQERYFESYDKQYALGKIREVLSRHGALLVEDPNEADLIVEARSGGLGIDKRETLLGIPKIPVPVPLAGTLTIPEIALYKSQKADAVSKIALFAYDQKSRAFVHATGSLAGGSRFHYYKFLWLISWRSTDIPELDPKIKQRLSGKPDE